MVAPLQLRDPALQRAYVALAGNSKIEAKDVDKLLSAARADDGKIDAVEKRDLQQVLAHNKDMFTSGAAEKLSAGLAERPLFALGGGGRRAVPVAADPRNPRQNPLDPHGVARSLARAQGIPEGYRPPEHKLSAADPRTLTPEYRAAAEARHRAQASIDRQSNLDPFAARVNGMWQSPSGRWERVGPSPLEVASQTAFVASAPGRIYSAVTAGKAVYTAIDDPTAGNIGTAALKVGLTGGGEYAKLVHSPLKPAITVSKGLYNAQTSTPRTAGQ